MSPGSKGDGSTTVTTERERELEAPLSPQLSMLQTRRSVEFDNTAHNQHEAASSASQVSMGEEVYENIDIDETEQSLLEVQMLKKHISLFEVKIGKSKKILTKR